MFKCLILLLLLCVPQMWSFDLVNLIKPMFYLKKIPGNGECVRQLNSLKNDFLTGTRWALEMVDASAKMHSGLMEGNLIEFGHFDQCLNIFSQERDIKGKYCLARMPFSKIDDTAKNFGISYTLDKRLEKVKNNSIAGIVWGLCIPDACTGDEITKLTRDYLHFADLVCQTKDDYPELTSIDFIAMSFFGLLFITILASTFYDLRMQNTDTDTEKRLYHVFSLHSNAKRLFETRNPSYLGFFHGIRSISITWIILGHMYSHFSFWGIINALDLMNFFSKRISMLLIGGHIAVDSFLFISGVLVTYSFMRIKKFNLPIFYLYRYFRLTPSLAVMVLLHLSFIKFALYGPLGRIGNNMYVEGCQHYWWSSLLHLQSWINPGKLCVPVSWYLSVDFQLYILSPILLIPLVKYTKQTLLVIVLLVCACAGITFNIVWTHKIPIFYNVLSQQQATYLKHYYYHVYTRASPWLIGLIVGYYLYKARFVQKSVNINKILVTFLWILAMSVMLTIVLSGHEMVFAEEYDPWGNSFNLAFVKIIWSIALSWVVYACATGYGGPVTWFLSLPIFEFLSNLTYSMNFTHYTIFGIMLFNKRQSTIFSHASALYDFCGHYVVIIAVSILWYLSIERPFTELGSYCVDKYYKKDKPNNEKKAA